MADTPISGLAALTVRTLAAGDKFAIDDVSAATTKSVLASDVRWLANTGAGVYNVKDYGALGDGVKITDGAITTGLKELTSASNPFVAGDVGKTIGVSAAGGTAITAPGAPTVAAAAGTKMAVGVYKYKITFVSAQGETAGGTESANATTTAGNQRVALTAIPTGGAGTTGRGIYRTLVGGATNTEQFVTYIGDNTTTTFNDTMPDFFLGAAVPTVDTTAAPLITTIAAFVGAGHVTLTAAASRTTTGSICTWGTDDTTNIHAARDAAGVGGKLYFPPGTYMSPQLTVNVAGQVWLLDEGATIRIMPQATATQVINESGGDGWQLIGGVIDGNKDNVGAMTVPIVRLNDSASTTGATIHGVEFTGAHDSNAQACVFTTRDYTTVEDCYFHDCFLSGVLVQTKAAPVFLQGTVGTTIKNNRFVNLKYVAIGVVGDLGRLTLNTTLAAGDTSIVSTTAIPTTWPQIGEIRIESEEIHYTSYTGSTFTTVASPNGRGYHGTTAAAHTAPTIIAIGQAFEASRVRDTHIADNTIKNCGFINDGAQVGAMEIFYANFYTSITNNYIEDCRSFAAFSIVGCYWAKIQNNTIVGPPLATLGTSQWGIELGNGKHYTITGNSIDMRTDTFQQPDALQTYTRGINWTGGKTDINRDNSITGNVFTNCEYGLNPGWCFGNAISGNGFYNIFYGGIGYASLEVAQDAVGDTVSGNVFRNPYASAPVAIGIACADVAGHGAQKTNIVGNQFINFLTGINTGDVNNQGFTITGNVFDGCTTNLSGTGGNVIAKANYPVAVDNDTFYLTTQHSISSATATEVTGLRASTLSPGTYHYKYILIVRSATSTVGVMLGINFTGTGNPRHWLMFADATAAITAESHIMDDQGVQTQGYIVGMADSTKSTTTPAMGTTLGVATTATDILCFIEGIIVVTAVGDLALWHGSETATATSVEVGSSLFLVRTN